MNRNIIKGNWKEIKGKLKQQWGKFTEDDITTMNGSFEELEGRLQKLYGYKKDQADREIESFVKKHGWEDRTH